FRLTDDGTNGDAVAGDGRFTGTVTFDQIGEVAVDLRAKSALLDKTIHSKVDVSGVFHYKGPALPVNLGTFKAGQESCRSVVIQATEHQGKIPFDVRVTRALPSDHVLEIRIGDKVGGPAKPYIALGAGENVNVCLRTGRHAPGSSASNE